MIGTQGTRRQLFRDCKVSMNKSVQISKHSSIFPLHLCLSNFLPIFLNPKKTLISSQSLCKNPENMSSMAATTGGRSFDSDITRWVIEFILRQLQTPVLTITKILTNRHVPLSNTSPRLKKSILLRQIDADIEDGSVSEKTLDAIETVEQIDRNEGDLIMDSMKNAYCAVAVECTVKYMLGNLQRARKGKFLEAVERVWKQRVGGLKREGRSELVTGKLMKCFEEMEVALKDDGVAKRWLKRNTRNEAVEMVRVYLGEAVAVSGPVFVEMVASMEMRGDGGLLCRKRGEGENEGVDVNLGGGEVNRAYGEK
ncbi:hypothetical protein OIU85_004211 [Salix viminalis]|uniref:Uncharacterized protein n=1 Tax=Salix viminalis TaxID=40686 RepID=A0A9Q0PSY0_SALVM|nr:hypothetical protein OIU85_004211 [Salix viminalis]